MIAAFHSEVLLATVRTGSPLLLVLHGNELFEFLLFFLLGQVSVPAV